MCIIQQKTKSCTFVGLYGSGLLILGPALTSQPCFFMDGHTLWYVHVHNVCIEYNTPNRDITPVTCISSIKVVHVVHESTTLSQGIYNVTGLISLVGSRYLL